MPNLLTTVTPFLGAIGFIHAQVYPLVSPNPSPQAQALADYMYSVYGEKIISGQMDEQHLDRIIEATNGKEPAIMGYDYYGLKPGAGHGDTEKAIRWAKEKGGIVQFTWHWDYPGGGGGFYDLGFDLPRALADTSQGIGKAMVNDMHAAAIEMEKLARNGIPLLWRPIHEAEGGWFWWGAKGGDACKQLYRLWFDILVHQHKLNNILWVWTSYAGEKNGNWYPGDDVVDIIVYDYPDPGKYFGKFQSLFGDEKMFAMGEVGELPDPDNFTLEPWSYFLCWDYMILKPGERDSQNREGKNSIAWIQKIYHDPRTITLDELPDYLLGTRSDSAVYCKPGIRCEAEAATRQGVSIATGLTGYSGTGYVTGFTDLDSNKNLSFAIHIDTAAPYLLRLGYATRFGAKAVQVIVNGTETGSPILSFSNSTWDVKEFSLGNLPSGNVNLALRQGNGYYEIDWIEIVAIRPITGIAKRFPKSDAETIRKISEWNLKGQRIQ